MKKLFGGLNLTWSKVIIAAVIAGIVTAVIAIIPALRYTSFNAVTVTFEVWVLVGIIMVVWKSDMLTALKIISCMLISGRAEKQF